MEFPKGAETRLREMEQRLEDVETELGDSATGARPDLLRSLGKEHADLRPTVELWRSYKSAQADLTEARSMLDSATGDEKAYLES